MIKTCPSNQFNGIYRNQPKFQAGGTKLYTGQNLRFKNMCFESKKEDEVIPQKYLDPVTGQILQDPHIHVQSREIYDKKTLESWLQKSLKQKEVTPLPDFASAIEQFQEINSNNTEENHSSEKINIKNIVENEADPLFQVIVNFQLQKQIYKVQTSEVEAAQQEVEKISEEIKSNFEAYRKPKQSFENSIIENNQIQNCFNSEEILKLEQNLNQEAADIKHNFEQCYQLAIQLCQKQKIFVQAFEKLKVHEKDLLNARESLISEHEKVGIVTSFKNEIGGLSGKLQVMLTDETQLQNLFSQGTVENVQFYIPSQKHISITIKKPTIVKSLKLTSINNTGYIEFIMENQDANISFENCQFYNIGLYVTGCICAKNNGYRMIHVNGQKCVNEVTIRNCVSENSSVQGILIQRCRSCIIEKTHVSNSAYSGIFIQDIPSFKINNVQVSKSGQYGVSFQQSSGYIRNSLIEYSKYSGMAVDIASEIENDNVDLKNNNVGEKPVQTL